jgi:alpha-tubulin suppressor-like RCC1 family protein
MQPERPGRLTAALSLIAFVLTLSCGEGTESPTAPASEPASLASAATPLLTFRQVSAGGGHACGVTIDDLAYCWGSNGVGQLGMGTHTGPESCDFGTACSTRPVAVLGGLHFRHVSTGATHTCGVTTGNRIYCWGDNGSGQLGIGAGTASETCDLNQPCSTRPVALAGGRRFREVTAGEFHTCAVNLFDRPFCWGYNGFGELGDGTSTNRSEPVRVSTGGLLFRQVSAGGIHTCGITTENRAYCWGWNDFAQLGDRTTTQRLTPTAVYGGLSFRDVSSGERHTCAVTTNERAYCWGRDFFGQLGDGTTYPRRLKPTAVLGGLSFNRVTAGVAHSCGETTLNRAYCWGAGGALGDGTAAQHSQPVRVSGGLFFGQLSTGGGYSCGLSSVGVAYCWGGNRGGQLGDGTTTDRLSPVKVIGPT